MYRPPVAVARIAVGAVAVLLLSAAPSQADIITLNFSGAADLSAVDGGQPNPHTFSGSITWDSTRAPWSSSPDSAEYDPNVYTLIFDGIDYSAPVIGDGTGSGMFVGNDIDILAVLGLGTGPAMDVFAFFMAFRPPFEISGQPSDLAVLALLVGPTTMFASTALPGDLGFLSQLTGAASQFLFVPDGGDDALLEQVGTLTLTIPGGPSYTPGPGPIPVPPPVPEPTMLALTALGVAGTLVRARRARKVS